MAFIKLENVVINLSYIAAIRLECLNSAGEDSVSLLIAIPTTSLFERGNPPQNHYHYEWLEFTGDSARALRDYFSSFNNVIDLSPQYKSPAYCATSHHYSGDRSD
jgi:hypothetical protein